MIKAKLGDITRPNTSFTNDPELNGLCFLAHAERSTEKKTTTKGKKRQKQRREQLMMASALNCSMLTCGSVTSC